MMVTDTDRNENAHYMTVSELDADVDDAYNALNDAGIPNLDVVGNDRCYDAYNAWADAYNKHVDLLRNEREPIPSAERVHELAFNRDAVWIHEYKRVLAGELYGPLEDDESDC